MAAAAVLAGMPAATATAQPAADAPSVVVAEVERRDVTPRFFCVGRVEAVETVARVEGFLERRDFREGGHVEKDDLLFLIESRRQGVDLEDPPVAPSLLLSDGSVVDRADRAVVRRVVLGEPAGAGWIVSEGLAGGQRVVVQGLRKIRPDLVVNPVEAQG